MFTVLPTETFKTWLRELKDRRGVAKIIARIDRAESGNLGDCSPVGEGVAEMRIDFGPGYRIYYVRRGLEVIILLGGGDKSTQKRDIAAALAMAREI